ncbi:MAG: YtxH domain-containing protein [Candidatus Krumholzibacteriia bacterium]
MSSDSNNVMAFLLGAAAGAVTALLLAPNSGEETRRRLREGAEDIYEQGEGAVREKTAGVRTRASETGGRVKERAQDVATAARSRVDAVREAATEARRTYSEEMKA